MADPTSNPGDIFTYLGMGIGGVIAVVVARLGWNSGGKVLQNPGDVVEVKSALVDSSSVVALAGSIEGHAMTSRELAKRSEEHLDRLITAMEAHTDELRQLSREVRELAREAGKKGG